MNIKFHDIATRMKENVERVVSNQHEEETVVEWKRTAWTLGGYGCRDDGDEFSVSTQFSLTQKKTN